MVLSADVCVPEKRINAAARDWPDGYLLLAHDPSVSRFSSRPMGRSSRAIKDAYPQVKVGAKQRYATLSRNHHDELPESPDYRVG
jgi:hypothetical protein